MASTLLPPTSTRALLPPSHALRMLSHRPATQLLACISRPTSISTTSHLARTSNRLLTTTATSSTQESTPTSCEFPPLPYHVHRTASQELPVYHLAKRGGNLHQTRIRKVDGDRAALRDELQRALDVKAGNIRVNQVTGHVVIKGWFKAEVKRFLEERHF